MASVDEHNLVAVTSFGDRVRVTATAEFAGYDTSHKPADFAFMRSVVQELYPDRKIVNRTVPDWIIRLVARFGGPARQIINDIGNEKVFDGRKGEALIGHPYFSARQSIKDTAESVIRLGLKFRMSKP